MRFRVEQRFARPATDIFKAYCEPGVYPRFVALDNIAAPEVHHHEVDTAGRVHLVVAYRYTGDLPAGAQRFVDTSNITVTEHVTYDPADNSGSFNLKTPLGSRFGGRGASTVSDNDAHGSVRTISGELRIGLPLVGRKVEAAIIEGYEESLLAQVRVVEAHLGDDTHTPGTDASG
jgi:hypothetical protein